MEGGELVMIWRIIFVVLRGGGGLGGVEGDWEGWRGEGEGGRGKGEGEGEWGRERGEEGEVTQSARTCI